MKKQKQNTDGKRVGMLGLLFTLLPILIYSVPMEREGMEWNKLYYQNGFPVVSSDESEYSGEKESEPEGTAEISDPNFPNLELRAQAFVLETKRLEFKGFSGAFNPSIVRYKGSILMAFRARDPITGSTNPIALVWLDEDCCPISAPQIVQVPVRYETSSCLQQDPRLIPIGDRLFMIYSNMVPSVSLGKDTRRVFIAELHDVDGQFIADVPDSLLDFEGMKEARWEKNWVPFEYQGELLLAYSLSPHRVFFPLYGKGYCFTVAHTANSPPWDWGVLRGGTQAFLEGNEYLAFFHSSKNMATTHSQGKVMQHYFMGAYTFSSKPPFALTRISPEPIVGKKFYEGPAYKTWKPLRVVFPGGYISNEKHIWIAYGRQDHEIWVTKLDKQGLLDSLIPVESTQ